MSRRVDLDGPSLTNTKPVIVETYNKDTLCVCLALTANNRLGTSRGGTHNLLHAIQTSTGTRRGFEVFAIVLSIGGIDLNLIQHNDGLSLPYNFITSL
jgi:hypothetical protein